MVACLRAFSTESAKNSLITVLDVFASDPTMDWVAMARSRSLVKLGATFAAEDDTSLASNWFPRAKVLVARLKLERVSPAVLYWLDLRANPRYGPVSGRARRGNYTALLKNLRMTVFGLSDDGMKSVRSLPACHGPYKLRRVDRILLEAAAGSPLAGNAVPLLDVELTAAPSVEAYVDAMTDLACDPNILLRMWTGLSTAY